jgi:hypothetical protein|tara:strand:- start:200 stop:631 length:432 start_codon:yes stop_codon:yes gene_type:complete
MAYSGKFIPTNITKYRGDVKKIVYRSLWERRFMVYCDNTSAILEWGSEEVIIPYVSPLDGRRHRYFPDFYIKVRQRDKTIKKMIIEVKPKIQCGPPKTPKRRTKRYINEVRTWGVNEAKWKAAIEWCVDRGMEFKILTEDHVG